MLMTDRQRALPVVTAVLPDLHGWEPFLALRPDHRLQRAPTKSLQQEGRCRRQGPVRQLRGIPSISHADDIEPGASRRQE